MRKYPILVLLPLLVISVFLWRAGSPGSGDVDVSAEQVASSAKPNSPGSVASPPNAASAAESGAREVEPAVATNGPAAQDGRAVAPTAPSAALGPGARLLELERRARAANPGAWQEWVDALTDCTSVLAERQASVDEYVEHLTLAPPNDDLAERWMAPLRADCQAVFPDFATEAGRQRASDRIQDALRQWAASGDPLGRLVGMQMTLQWPMPDENWRGLADLASAYLDPARPDTVLNIADGYIQTFSRFPSSAAWRLAACDLGYDCQSGGALNRRLCLHAGECFDGTYEEYLLRQMPPRQWQSLQSQRRALVELLRTGDTRTPFDVPPPGGP